MQIVRAAAKAEGFDVSYPGDDAIFALLTREVRPVVVLNEHTVQSTSFFISLPSNCAFSMSIVWGTAEGELPDNKTAISVTITALNDNDCPRLGELFDITISRGSDGARVHISPLRGVQSMTGVLLDAYSISMSDRQWNAIRAQMANLLLTEDQLKN